MKINPSYPLNIFSSLGFLDGVREEVKSMFPLACQAAVTEARERWGTTGIGLPAGLAEEVVKC